MTAPTTGVVLIVAGRSASDGDAIQAELRDAGLKVGLVPTVEQALQPLDDCRTDVRILSGGEDQEIASAVESMRSSGFSGSILVVRRNPDPAHVAAVLDSGADDYVRLPCNAKELVARVRALVRRQSGPTVLEREVDGLVLDLRRGVVRSGDVEVALTRREADLMEYLTRHAGHAVSRAELATQIWHTTTPSNGGTNIVDVYVSYLRRKLGTLGRQSIIRSVRGVGYELRASDYSVRS
jgi:two-component system, OmpR family, copper resistance phosphate regulon response regulator CusR